MFSLVEEPHNFTAISVPQRKKTTTKQKAFAFLPSSTKPIQKNPTELKS